MVIILLGLKNWGIAPLKIKCKIKRSLHMFIHRSELKFYINSAIKIPSSKSI